MRPIGKGSWLFIDFMFLAGVGITLACGYFLVTGVYQAVAWHTTKGTITGYIVKDVGDDEIGLFAKAVFTAPEGEEIEVIARGSVSEEKELRSGEVTIFYNPDNPSEAVIFILGDYLILFMLPFAALLMYLGWPFHSDPPLKT